MSATTVYTCGNTRLTTVRAVAAAIGSVLTARGDGHPRVRKVVLFNSPEAHEPMAVDAQTRIYREFLGSIPVEDVPVPLDAGEITPSMIEPFRSVDSKFVDLTNGPKAIAAQLYLMACLLRVDDIYYFTPKVPAEQMSIESAPGVDFDYVRVPRFDRMNDLARLSYLDLIYYKKEVEEVLEGVPPASFLNRVRSDLDRAVDTFFRGGEEQAAVRDATIFHEAVLKELFQFVQKKADPEFVKRHGIRFEQRDPLGVIAFFFRVYAEQNVRDPRFDSLIGIHGILSMLRAYRHLSSHPGSGKVNARLAINAAIECLRCARGSNAFWEKLKARRT